MNSIIEITVSTDGQTKVETQGFTGSDCRIASQFLESALGKPVNETLKPAFYQSEVVAQQNRAGT